jgi:hypothetical protein
LIGDREFPEEACAGMLANMVNALVPTTAIAFNARGSFIRTPDKCSKIR